MRGTGRTTRALEECKRHLIDGRSTIYVCASWLEVTHAMRICADVLGLEVQGVLRIARQPHSAGKTPAIFFTALDVEPEKFRPYQAPVDFDHHAASKLFDLPYPLVNRWNEVERIQEKYRYDR